MSKLISRKPVNEKVLLKKFLTSQKGEGYTGLIITVATVLIVAAFVMIPGLRTFGTTILTALNNWWTTTISTRIFPTT